MTDYRKLLNDRKASRNHWLVLEKKLAADRTVLDKEITEHTEAREIMNAVQLATQVTIKDFIEEIVSLGLKSVFGNQYGFKIEYEVKRSRSEATLYVTKNGQPYDAEASCGGGILDVAAFGLRVALFALANPKPESVLVLDEPGKWVSRGDLVGKFGQMLKEVSKMMGIQIIMISHDPALIESADRAFKVSQANGASVVELV
jgi:DNA repair exonuclease SbcCD ATPase subunit